MLRVDCLPEVGVCMLPAPVLPLNWTSLTGPIPRRSVLTLLLQALGNVAVDFV